MSVPALLDDVLDKSLTLKDAYEHNRNRQTNIEQALIQLQESYPDTPLYELVNNLEALLPSLIHNKLHLFFSYKGSHQKQITAIRDLLVPYCPDKLEIYGAKYIEFGEEWRRYIDTYTGKANWFVLFYFDPDLDWGWCLYECGLFERKKCLGERDFCIFPANENPPSQLEHLQGVPTTDEGLTAFLDRLFVKPNAIPGLDPLNPEADIATLKDNVSEILLNLKRVRKTKPAYFDYFVELAVPSFGNAKNSSPASISGRVERIKGARVVGTDDATLRLFGRAMKAKTFGELIEVAVQTDGDPRWLNDLDATLELASKGYTNLKANNATLAIGAKRFRPFLHRVDTFEGTDEIERYHISIIEDTSAPSALRIIDKDYAMVAELLKFSFRMKFEVLEPASAAQPSATAIKDVIDALTRVDTDARLVGLEKARFEQLLNSLMIQKVLQSQEASEIRDSVKRWTEIHATQEQPPKALEVAIANDEYEKVLNILRSFGNDNDRFLKIMVNVFERMTIGDVDKRSAVE